MNFFISRSSFTANTYTTRDWFEGKVANTGFKVEPLVDGVKTGQELWFPNPGFRRLDGTIYPSPYGPGNQGNYWSSVGSGDNGSFFYFRSNTATGSPFAENKLYAQPVRCVR